MLIVDKLNAQTRFILTVTESTTVPNPSYVMKVYSHFNKRTLHVPLPDNTSSHLSRYDEFIIATSVFDECDEGLYSYTIEEATDGVVEQGVLKVVGNITSEQQFESITPDEADDDFIVYK